MKKLINSFKYAIQGIISCFKTEQNMKIHLIIMLFVIIVGFILNLSKLEWIICIILFGVVISFEIINTAIEKTVDMITTEISPKAKIVKDISAGGVLVATISAIIIGLMIFVPKIMELITI